MAFTNKDSCTTIKKGQQLELEVTQTAFGGKGLTRVDGFAIFVEKSVPGDRVLARITRKKKNYAEARPIELLEPSSLRVTAPCPYSGICGGCSWQFLGYEHQLAFKQQHVHESLEHIGALENVVVHPTLPSDLIFGYRNKMEFSCAPRRWLLPHELGCADIQPGIALGLHVPGTFHKVLDIEACLLLPQQGSSMLADVREYIRSSALPVYGLRSHEGFWRFVVLRHSVVHDHWMVNIVTAWNEPDQVLPLAEQLRCTYPNLVSVVNNITGRKAGIAVGETEVLLAGQPFIEERIGPFMFELSANSFFQTNSRGAAQLYNLVRDYAALTGVETVFDLYCGTGTIAIFLADRAQLVVGLEMVESAVDDAQRNCRKNGVENCRFIAGDIRRTLSALMEEEHAVVPDVVVIDPPRVGMHEDVVEQVLSLAPRKIVYVSCNPATLARDAVLLNERYQVMEVQPVDMFPHTFHIECVARLERR